MKEFRFIIAVALLCMANRSVAQIEISANPETQDTIPLKEVVIANPLELRTEVLGYANWSSTTRLLEVNEGLFADTLGERANETSLNVWSYGLAFRSQIRPFLSWQGGISLIRNGESYSREIEDTTFSYQSYYTYVAMPFKVFYVKTWPILRVYAGGGLVPQMFFGYRQEQQWVTAANASNHETFKTKNGYNSFVVSAVANVGLQLYMQRGTSIIIEPEYRYQFVNSYTKTDGFRHFGRALGVNLGFSYTL